MKKLNVQSPAAKMTGSQLIKEILAGNQVEMLNGWKLKKVQVSNDIRIEVTPKGYPSRSTKLMLDTAGVIIERISYANRYFVPTGETGGKTIYALMKSFGMNAVGLGPADSEESARLSRSGQNLDGVSLTKEELADYAAQLLGDSKKQPQVVVKQRASELPFDAPGDAKGALWNGIMYLVANNVSSAADARQVVAHEVIGHFCLAGFFGEALRPALAKISAHNPSINKAAKLWIENNPDIFKEQNLNPVETYYRSIEEAMAQMAEDGKSFTYATQLLKLLRDLFRKTGLDQWADKLESKHELVNYEALKMLHQAGLYVERPSYLNWRELARFSKQVQQYIFFHYVR